MVARETKEIIAAECRIRIFRFRLVDPLSCAEVVTVGGELENSENGDITYKARDVTRREDLGKPQ
jgi:hypothetical protein